MNKFKKIIKNTIQYLIDDFYRSCKWESNKWELSILSFLGLVLLCCYLLYWYAEYFV